MKKLLLLLILTVGYKVLKAQNVGINANGATPNTSAMLDIDVSSFAANAKKGLLIPRVALSGTGDVATIPSAATGLFIFNTAAAGAGATAVSANTFYYWDGAKWVALGGNGGKEWNTLGNSGTTAGTNFLGTTDDIDLQFKRNNILAGQINSASQISTFGLNAGLAVTGADNSFFGHSAGKTVTTGVSNTGIGVNAAKLATSSYNTAVGTNSLQALTSGGSNTFMGVSSGYYYSTGSGNTGIGMYAVEGGNGTGTGSYNTAIGFAAGSGYTGAGTQNYLALTSGSYNSFLGYSAAALTGALVNATAIGAYSRVDQSNTMVLGSINTLNGATATTTVGIGTTTPKVEFMLDVKTVDGVSGTGWSSTTAAGGIIGRTQSVLTYQAGVFGYNTGSVNNTAGVLGAYSSTQFGALGYRDGSAIIIGAFGTTSNASGYGVLGENTNASGTGVYGYGSTYGVYGYTPSVASGTYGAFGAWSSLVYGYLGGKTASGQYVGVYGTTSSSTSFGVLGHNTNSSGSGSTGAGNNTTPYYLVAGSGVGGTGTQFGVYGNGTNTTDGTIRSGGYFECSGAASYVYVGARTSGSVNRKVEGNGTVNTVVKDVNDKLVVLSAPEAPENLFFDMGQGELVNGKAIIILDPTFSKNIVVNKKHPLRVFIQLEGDCNGVYVANKTQYGFEVIELGGGSSNTSFVWQAHGNRADEINSDGSVSPYSEERFSPAIGPQQSIKSEVDSKPKEKPGYDIDPDSGKYIKKKSEE